MAEQTLNSLIDKINSLATAEQILHAIGYMPEGIEQRGSNLRCFCPIHKDELLRSLAVDIQKGTFRCSFSGCGGRRGGRYFDLYRLALDLSAEEAVKRLCPVLGIDFDPDHLVVEAEEEEPVADSEAEEGIDIADIAAMLDQPTSAAQATAEQAQEDAGPPSPAEPEEPGPAPEDEPAAAPPAFAPGAGLPAEALDAFRQELDDLRARLAEPAADQTGPLREEVGALRQSLASVQEELSGLRDTLAQATQAGDLAALEKQLEAVRQLAESSDSGKDLLQVQSALNELQTRLDGTAAAADISRLGEQLEALREQLGARATSAELEELRRLVAEARSGLEGAASAAELAQLREQLEALRTAAQSSSSQDDLAAVRGELEVVKEGVSKAARTVPQAVEAELAGLRDAVDSLPRQDAVAALEAAVAELRADQRVAALAGQVQSLREGMDALSGSVDLAGMQEQLKELSRMQKGLKGLAAQKEVEELQQALAALREDLAQTTERARAAEAVQSELAKVKEQLTTLVPAEALSTLQTRIESIQLALASSDVTADVAALKAQVGELQETGGALAELGRRLEALQAEQAAERDHVSQLAKTVPPPVAAELTMLRDALSGMASSGDLQDLAQGLKDVQAAVGKAADEQALEPLRGELAALRESVAQLSAADPAKAVAARLEELQQRQQAGLEKLAGQQEGTTAQLQAQLDELRGQLASAAASDPAEALAALRDELQQRHQAELQRAEAEHAGAMAQLRAEVAELRQLLATATASDPTEALAAMRAEMQQIQKAALDTLAAEQAQALRDLRGELERLDQTVAELASTGPRQSDDKMNEVMKMLAGRLDSLEGSADLARRYAALAEKMGELTVRVETLQELEAQAQTGAPGRPRLVAKSGDETEGGAGVSSIPQPGREWDEDGDNRKVIFL